MRAVVDREQLAQLRGVNAARSSAVAWILTMILAGLGGVLIAPLFSLDETTITFIVLGSLAAVALARLRSIPIALLGGLLLGIVANLVAGYSNDVLPDFLANLSGLRTSVPYVITLLLLMFWVASRKREPAGGHRRRRRARARTTAPACRLATAPAVGDRHPLPSSRSRSAGSTSPRCRPTPTNRASSSWASRWA